MIDVLIRTATAVGALTVLIGALAAVSRTRPARWFWRTLVGKPLSAWFRGEVSDIVDEEIDGLKVQLGVVLKRTEQLLPNEGKSIKDTVTRMGQQITTAVEERHLTDEKINHVQATVDELQSTMTSLHAKYVEDTAVQDQRLDNLEGK